MEEKKEDEQKDITIQKKKVSVMYFLLIVVVFAIGIFTGIQFAPQDVVPININDTTCGIKAQFEFDNELVYVMPTGCGELCYNLTEPTLSIAQYNGLTYREVVLNANITVPGIFLIRPGYITHIIPFDTVEALPEIFCNEFEYEEYCQN